MCLAQTMTGDRWRTLGKGEQQPFCSPGPKGCLLSLTFDISSLPFAVTS